MKYELGQKVSLNLIDLAKEDTDLTFVQITHLGNVIFLFNDLNELCCVHHEQCVIERVAVNKTDRGPVYELKSTSVTRNAHFMLTEMDLDIATL